MDQFRNQDKLRSWNEFGSTYWGLAGKTSHPSPQEVESFLAGSAPGVRVLVIGATTTEVIGAAVATGAQVHVLDFAPKLLGLVRARFGASVPRYEHDVLNPPPTELAGRFDIVVADRMLNRFHRSEMGRVLSHLASFAAPSGELRVSVRFGLYPLDERLLARARNSGRSTDSGTKLRARSTGAM